jgi:hypothetical protein
MIDLLRRFSRIKGCLIGLALAAAFGVTGAASAQFGQAAGFNELMSSYYLRRDLQLFIEGLDMDEGQSVILESLFWDYQDEHEAGKTEMIERLTSMREELQTIDRERILKIIFVPFEEWSIEWDALNEQFIESVKAILNDRQLERWPKFERKLTREKQLPLGRFSGEKLNLFHILTEMDLDVPTRTLIEPVLDDYDLRMNDALLKRLGLSRQSRMLMINSMREEDPQKLLQTYDRQIAASVEVRSVNDEYVEAIAAALPNELGATFRQMALERAFARVYRPTPAQRILAAARELESLTPDIRQAVIDLERDYLAELAVINDQLAALLRDYEPKNEQHRAAAFALRGTGQRPERPKDPTRDEFRRRDELGKRYIELLKALLTDEQLGSLPGIQRFYSNPRPKKGARPGLGDAMEGGTEGEAPKKKERPKGSGFGPDSGKKGLGGGDGPK